jgi:hypothetical protein
LHGNNKARHIYLNGGHRSVLNSRVSQRHSLLQIQRGTELI